MSSDPASAPGLIPLSSAPAAERQATSRRVFCVHAVSGSPLAYLPLASRLGEEFTVHGLQAAGLTAGQTPRESVLAMARAYADTVERVGPGPEGFLLCGWSMGGLIAFEMAGVLIGRGHPVRVATIDTQFPRPGTEPALDETGYLLWYAEDVVATLGGDPEELAGLFGAPGFADLPLEDRLLRLAGTLGMGRPGERHRWVDELRRRFAVFTANVRAVAAYRPARTPVDVLAVHASGSPVDPAEWRPVVDGELRGVMIEGDHYSLVRQPDARRVADLVAAHFTG